MRNFQRIFNEFSTNSDENKARISSKFALITFAQYCSLSCRYGQLDKMFYTTNNFLEPGNKELKHILKEFNSIYFAQCLSKVILAQIFCCRLLVKKKCLKLSWLVAVVLCVIQRVNPAMCLLNKTDYYRGWLLQLTDVM